MKRKVVGQPMVKLNAFDGSRNHEIKIRSYSVHSVFRIGRYLYNLDSTIPFICHATVFKMYTYLQSIHILYKRLVLFKYV